MGTHPRSPVPLDHETHARGILITRTYLAELAPHLGPGVDHDDVRVDRGDDSILARYQYEEAGDLWLLSFAGWCGSEDQAEELLAELLWHLQEDAINELVDPSLDDLEDLLALGDVSNTWRINVQGRAAGTICGLRIGGSVLGFLAVGEVWDTRHLLKQLILPRLPALRRWRDAEAM